MTASCFWNAACPNQVSFDDGRVKSASYNAAEGFGLRAVRGEVTGYAHSTQ